MRAKLAPEDQMTVEEFLAFAEARPDGERWELIEGVAIMNAAPAEFHQLIAGNILSWLIVYKTACGATWTALMGVGTRVPASPNSLPQPDVYIKAGAPTAFSITEDALVLFEVLSKSNTKADQAWRKRVYASVPNCQHYVTVAQGKLEVIRYDRASGWKGVPLTTLDKSLDLPALGAGVSIPLADIYRWTPLAPA